MKTERRHELETNYLADRLAAWLEKAKPYTSTVGIGVIALLVALIAKNFFSQQSAERNAEQWEAYYRKSEKPAQDREGFLKLADDYENTPIEPWAALAAADASMQQGCSLLWIDKKEAAKHLNAAVADYEAIIKSKDDDILVQ
ncbi:MAG: hypothetical protein KDA42_18970, partial [Planctomycetales bacterium]|nr:hypothetical protein [Planctomycetales bacterium]